MRRLPLIRWRVGVILVVGLLAIFLVAIILVYAARGADRMAGLPQPQQLAAIVTLIETTPPGAREEVFRALRSAQMSVRVAAEAEVETDLDPLWPGEPERAARYRIALGERGFAAYALPRKFFPRQVLSPLTAAEFRVALRGGGVLIVASEGLAFFTTRGLPVGFPAAFLGIVIALVALILLNREFRPVRRLAHAVEALDPADPEARLPRMRAGTAEVRMLMAAFDRQQERVGTLLRARSALIGGIQHDVRTFATRLRLRVEKLADPGERALAEGDIADLIALTDSALLATRSDAGKLDLELVSPAEVLEGEVRDRIAAGAAVTLSIAPGAADAHVLADRLALRRIVANLIDNAIRYGIAAHLTLEAEEGAVTLIVDDEGPGIPEALRRDLLQPFARLEPSRSRATGGAGLGLAIVESLVAGHKGRVTIGDAPGGGARVSVELPRFTGAD
ncbi:MAG: ATP-binding protein [Pseudomonadota bacterium]